MKGKEGRGRETSVVSSGLNSSLEEGSLIEGSFVELGNTNETTGNSERGGGGRRQCSEFIIGKREEGKKEGWY
jgi:hypothetical protein